MVALAEMGDKTQLLAFALACRFKRPWVILAGILVATLANHFLAALTGDFLAHLISAKILAFVVSMSFLVFAVWIMIPDKDEDVGKPDRFGPFLTAMVLFFLAEMGDKTQLVTVALGARFQALFPVVAGTTCGMMLADGLAIWLGDRLGHRLPLGLIRGFTALFFAVFGMAGLAGILWPGFKFHF
jgi:Ca2+/H+ antiporter, TMEM165/GDT1 family